MVVCIVAVIALVAVTAGAMSYLRPWIWSTDSSKVYFHYDALVGTTTGPVTLNADLGAGSIIVRFEDNASLLYRVDVAMNNRTYQSDGPPTVAFASGVITVTCSAGVVNVTLGSGITYVLHAVVDSGSIGLNANDYASLKDVLLTVKAGTINVLMDSAIDFVGNCTWNLNVSAGTATVVVVAPIGLGMSFDGQVVTGTVDVQTSEWIHVGLHHYQTPGYATASQTVEISASVTTGTINAYLLRV